MTLHLADKFTLPLETVTESLAILARKRAGKSHTAKRLVEQLHKAHQRVVIIDPKGDWWGLRSSADGKGPGLPIVILGGEHGAVPLEAGSGELVARLIVQDRVSALLDLARFRKHEVATFRDTYLQKLKARELIAAGRHDVRASGVLFDER
jgi:DNA helicase HerA-like ATPase